MTAESRPAETLPQPVDTDPEDPRMRALDNMGVSRYIIDRTFDGPVAALAEDREEVTTPVPQSPRRTSRRGGRGLPQRSDRDEEILDEIENPRALPTPAAPDYPDRVKVLDAWDKAAERGVVRGFKHKVSDSQLRAIQIARAEKRAKLLGKS